MIKRILIFIIPIIAMFIIGFKPHDEPNNGNSNNPGGPYRILSNPNQVLAVDSKQLNANQINTWFRTNGSFNRDPSTGNAGFEWPKGQAKFARYASGLWLGCTVGNDTLTAVAEFSYDYLPGFVDDNGSPQGQDNPLYRIYSITQGNTTDPDYLNWPINQGAYVDSLGKPLFLGTQTMFYVYTDGYPHTSGSTSLASLKAQILQTNWSYNVNGPLGNILFQEYRVINRSNNIWTNTYLSQWTDDDLGGANDDKVGVDTVLNLGFTYNATNNDPNYGSAPPAVGFDYFRGPIVQTGNPDDSVVSFNPPGSNNRIVKRGFRELGLTVFNFYNNTSPEPADPRNNTETYRVMSGFQRLGTEWIDPITNQPTKKVYSGDPVANTGWLMAGGSDRRFIQSSGPFTMNPGDTQSVIVAQVIGRGNSNIGSVQVLKQTDALAQRIFDNNFQVPESAPIVPVSAYAPGNGKIYLSWGDTAEKISIPNKLSSGTYTFQGYNVYAIKPGTSGSEASDRVLIATYDRRDGIQDILDSVFNTTLGAYVYYAVQKGSDNGISRFIVIEQDNINNTFIANGTEYPFVVTAYYYDSLGGPFSAPKVNETPITSANIIKVIPQNLTSGTVVNYGLGDTIFTNQRDLAVMPIVIKPFDLITATYESQFGGTNANPTWTLIRSTGGSTTAIFENVPDFKGLQDTAKTVDGFLLIHQLVTDSGIVKDPGVGRPDTTGHRYYTRQKAWTYEPENNLWLAGLDTSAINSSRYYLSRQFQSRSISMSFPTENTFNNRRSRIFANGTFLRPGTGANTLLTGGPLRKFQIIFGQNSNAYRYAPASNVLEGDTTSGLAITNFADMVNVPFSVFAIDELDSTGGAPRQLNVAFVDADNNGIWDPDTTALGKFQLTYIMASNYDANPSTQYTNKNPGTINPISGFPSMDIMYVWVPRVQNRNGAPLTFTNGDKLTVTPYRITRPDFVPGYPIRYFWDTKGTQIADPSVASGELSQVKAFPNPYYGGTRLESDPFDRFIYISHLPQICDIYVYTLDGILVKKIVRNNTDPNNSLEKWNLQNSNDIPVASGLYIIYIDAKNLGTRTLKVAIFTPQERIDTF